MADQLNSNDVGTFFLYAGDVYRMIGYNDMPTVIMERVGADRASRAGDKQSFGINGLMAKEFIRLVPEDSNP